MKKSDIFLAVGLLSVASGILIKRFGGEFIYANFFEGFLIGLALVFLTTSLLMRRKKQQI